MCSDGSTRPDHNRNGIAQIRTVLKPRCTSWPNAASRSSNGSPGPAWVYQLKSHSEIAMRGVDAIDMSGQVLRSAVGEAGRYVQEVEFRSSGQALPIAVRRDAERAEHRGAVQPCFERQPVQE